MATALVSLLTDTSRPSADRHDGRNNAQRQCAAGWRHEGEIPGCQTGGGKGHILPADNRMNVEEDLTPEQLEGVKVHFVSTIEEALELALPASRQQERQDAETRERVLSNV